MILALLALIVGLVLVSLAVLWIVGERGRLMMRSTPAFFRAAGGWRARLHAYIYGRWTGPYVDFLLNKTPSGGGGAGAAWLAEHYHGKVLTHDHAEAIVTLDRPIEERDLEQIIPFQHARKLVLDGPPDVAAYECYCRHARVEHCQPTQVCMVIGKPFVDFVLEHHPDTARRLTQQEAVDLLREEHERGHLHSAWFKDAMGDRFYSICNCCKCCCGGIQSMRGGVRMMASSGYVAEIDGELCGHCEVCAEVCPFDAISSGDDGMVRDWEKCLGCGACEVKCANHAIRMVRDERKGIPLDVRALA
jgi:NAD-dependent dihydropyrimidine dehydrogenase PreA subunit